MAAKQATSSNEMRTGSQARLRGAVVDIGSNSVRLVIFDGARRAPALICNEKALCGLGRDMTKDGALEESAIDYALETLRRFQSLLDAHGNPPTNVIATAAVREAKNGVEFVGRVRDLGFDVKVIDGSEEARFAALGVVSYEPGATGLVGDMGGGSLELSALDNAKLGDTTSLSIGPLRMMQKTGGDIVEAERLIHTDLDRVSWLKKGKFNTLYSVGGAWRAVARIHMRIRSHPLSILHHYELSAVQAIEICDLIAHQSRRSLENIPGIPRRRIDTLPYASLVLKTILQRIRAQKMVVSAGGVREGLLFDALSKKQQQEDPLLAGCNYIASRNSPDPLCGAATAAMIDSLYTEESQSEERLRRATCALIDIAAYFHPNLRAIHAFDSALRTPFYGITHTERIWMALALYARHEGSGAGAPDEQAVGLLSWEEQQRAIRLGLAMRFSAALAPKAAGPLAGCSLRLEDGKLTFRAPAECADLMGEAPRKRLEALAFACDAEAMEIYDH